MATPRDEAGATLHVEPPMGMSQQDLERIRAELAAALGPAAELEASADPWESGFALYLHGDLDAAVERLAAVSPDHPQYARAQRYLGYNIAVRENGQALSGLVHLHASVRADPWNGNIWQDLVRAYPRAALELAGLARTAAADARAAVPSAGR